MTSPEKIDSKIGKEREIVPRGKTNYGKEVLEPLQIKEGEVFIDVGSGVGLQVSMAAKLKGAEAMGLEFQRSTIKLAEFVTKITELSFQERKIGKEVSGIIIKTEEEIAKKTGKKLEDYKFYELAKKMEKGEFSGGEKEKLQNDLLDWFVGKNLYRTLYLTLKSVDPLIEEKISKTKLPERVKFAQVDAAHLPIKSDCADKVLFLDVMHWIPSSNRPKVIEEIFRIAKNGSKLGMSLGRMEGLGKEEKEIIEEIAENKSLVMRIAKEKNITLKEEERGVFTILKAKK